MDEELEKIVKEFNIEINEFSQNQLLNYIKLINKIETKCSLKYEERWRFTCGTLQNSIESITKRNQELQKEIANKSVRQELHDLLVKNSELEKELEDWKEKFNTIASRLNSTTQKNKNLNIKLYLLKSILKEFKFKKQKEEYEKAIEKIKIKQEKNSEEFEPILENDYKETLEFLKERG